MVAAGVGFAGQGMGSSQGFGTGQIWKYLYRTLSIQPFFPN
jgi:hypothetical protein